MIQYSLEKYFDSQRQDGVFRYAISIHVKSDTEDIILNYMRERFEVWYVVVPEVSENGNYHLQGYGESHQEFVKNERKQFQPKGRYHKYLNADIKKPFGCSSARRSRYYNVMYVLKQIRDTDDWLTKGLYCSETDKDRRFQMWIESQSYQGQIENNQLRNEKSQSYETKMSRWYLDKPVNERPQDIGTLAELIMTENMVPWQHCTVEAIAKISRYLLMSHGSGTTRNRMISRMKDQVVNYDNKYMY